VSDSVYKCRINCTQLCRVLQVKEFFKMMIYNIQQCVYHHHHHYY